MRNRANKSSKPASSLRGQALPARSLASSRSGLPTLLATLLAAFVLAAVLAAPALAVESHPFINSIGPEGTGPGAFQQPQSVTVDPVTRDVYVLEGDKVNPEENEDPLGTLYKFDSEGKPLNFSATGTNFIKDVGASSGGGGNYNQIAIAPPGSPGGTAGDIYVANRQVVKIFSHAGAVLGQITADPGSGNSLCGVTTDAAGNVFVTHASAGAAVIRKYTAVANPLTNADEKSRAITSSGETCNLAIDSHGRIYASGSQTELNVTESGPGSSMLKFQFLETETPELVDFSSMAVAVEPGSNDVYVSHNKEIVQYGEDASYTKEGSLIGSFGIGRLGGGVSISVAEAGGDVYVSDMRHDRGKDNPRTHGRVDVFGPLTTLPKAVAKTATSITKTSAVLNGAISADGGPATTCRFEYVTQAAFEFEGFEGAGSVPCEPGGPFTGAGFTAVSAEATGLKIGTQYRFRLVGENENGALGSDETGAGQAPSFESQTLFAVHTGEPTGLLPTSMTLNGSINPEGLELSECYFEFEEIEPKPEAKPIKVPCKEPKVGEIGNGNSPVAVHALLTGLTESTGYRYRLIANIKEVKEETQKEKEEREEREAKETKQQKEERKKAEEEAKKELEEREGVNGVVVAEVRGTQLTVFTTGVPQVSSQAFSEVTQTGAILSGLINPSSSSTTYYAEYVTEAAFLESEYKTATKVPVAGVSLGEGHTSIEVSQELAGLTPATTYHVRFSATNGIGTGTGPDQVMRTQLFAPSFGSCPENESFRVEASALLPDCRAYEQASSPDKNGDSVAGIYSLLFASEDGSKVTFYSPAGAVPPADSGGTQTYPTYMASRDGAAGSWSSQRLLPGGQFGEEAEYLGSTPDLRYAVSEVGPFAHKKGLFVTDTDNGTVTQIVPYLRQVEGHGLNVFGFDGASADGSRIFFESFLTVPTASAEPASAPGKDNLYMWDRGTGDVSLVGVLPSGEAPANGSFGGPYEWYEGEDPSTGGVLNTPSNSVEPLTVVGLHAISPNGSQVVFTAADTGQLYLRRGLDGPSPTTTYISTPNAGLAGPPGKSPAAFQEATPDGSRVFFLSRQRLTTDAKTGSGEKGRDLYMWDASAPSSKALVDVAPDQKDENGADVQGLVGANPSGTAGYFVARGILAEGAEKGGENLYRFTEKTNGSFKVTFIATLAPGDNGLGPDRRNVSPKVSLGYLQGRNSRLSEDGETLLFTSIEPLTGYNNVSPEGIGCTPSTGHLCPELYLYSAKSGALNCVSCDPSGEAPMGAATLQDQFFNAYFTPNEAPAAYPSRNLSAAGTRVFFQSSDSLVAADTNGRGQGACPSSSGHSTERAGTGRCQDIYEWEAVGSGSCTAAEADGGCLYLLTTGKSPNATFFVGASKDGSNAFFATDSQLVPQDRDHADDVYDVRVGGGLASQHANPPVPCDSAEACKVPGPTAAPGPTPGSAFFQGPGNQKPKQCKKGFVGKHGKCVKQKAKKKHHKNKKNKKKRTTAKHSGGAK